jgi:hypothetical protein
MHGTLKIWGITFQTPSPIINPTTPLWGTSRVEGYILCIKPICVYFKVKEAEFHSGTLHSDVLGPCGLQRKKVV